MSSSDAGGRSLRRLRYCSSLSVLTSKRSSNPRCIAARLKKHDSKKKEMSDRFETNRFARGRIGRGGLRRQEVADEWPFCRIIFLRTNGTQVTPGAADCAGRNFWRRYLLQLCSANNIAALTQAAHPRKLMLRPNRPAGDNAYFSSA